VNEKGKKAIIRKFYRGWDFSEGLAVAMEQENGKWGYIDTHGQFVIGPRFAWSSSDYVWDFSGGFALIEVSGKFGYINRTGQFTIAPKFLYADEFQDGMARVVAETDCAGSASGHLDDGFPSNDEPIFPKDVKADSALPRCTFNFIDTSGRVISDQRYDDARPFGEGIAPVSIGGLWGYIDKSGHVAISPRFQNADTFSDGVALVFERGRFGYVDHTGAYVIAPQFKYAERFAEGLAVVSDGTSGYWYIDHVGNPAIPSKFALASRFFKGLAHVKLLQGAPDPVSSRGRFAYIDRSGKKVFEYSPE
jgi:hypothetical protein